MTVAPDWTVTASGLARDANLQGEIEHRVIVRAKRARGRQQVGEFGDPALSAGLSVISVPLETSEPACNVVVNDHGALAAMQREPCSCSVGPDPRQSKKLGHRFGWTASARGDLARRLVQQGPSPVETSGPCNGCCSLRAGCHEFTSGWETLPESLEYALCLRSPSALDKELCDEGKPWV